MRSCTTGRRTTISSSTETTRTTRGLRGPAAAVVVALAFLVTMLGATLPTPLYPIYEQELGFGGVMVTLVFATYAVGVTVALLFFGRLSDQLGRRAVLLPGLALAAVSSAVFLVDDLPALFVGRLLSGLSAGIFTGTATAALVDLAPEGRQNRYSLVAACVNMLGLGLGPVVAGALAEYLPAPLYLPYAVHIVMVVVVGAFLWAVVEPTGRSEGPVSWRPQRVSVPPEVRGVFVRAAIAGFAGFAVLGLFTAVSPSFLGQVLGVRDHLVTGLVVFTLLGASTVGQIASSRLSLRPALLVGCAALVIGVAGVGAALALASLALLVAGAAVAGVGQGMSFRAGLGAVNAGSPPERRSEVASSFFLVLYVGISLPVIGEGVASAAFGLVTAGVVFAGIVALLGLVAFVSLLLQRRVAG
ncbi:MFS transporter [Actinomycetospora lemnae]|uniref:MFS transporter n=1 Tax=Actinomycetospora lemnae TaxID=3019891 RepID=A0ABT5SQI6_9PSEU|nr:MFS transporter [Actinomycetospora sp. DW7H6]MDD7964926.1 MFS transporter [Actinomycetospora sp. DW7H6]